MKFAVAIAGEHALPSAFVVFRGFADSIRKASTLGYDGVELALKSAQEIDKRELASLLQSYHLAVSCISTGQVYASLGYSFTDTDHQKRVELRAIFEQLIDLAADFGRMVNIGRVRGSIGTKSRQEADELFIDMAYALCSYAQPKGVTLVLEPVNRYEIDYINSVEEGAELLRKANISNLKLMPDVFHMNIEDARIGEALERYRDDIAYIHLADSNRHAPGDGHLDFDEIFTSLKRMDYHQWCAVEILPVPDPDTAASRAIAFLRKYQ